MSVERDVPVELRDGTLLYADVYRPAGNGRYPVLLQRTPYDKQLYNLAMLQMDALRAVSRGYCVVMQDVRGRYRSEGEFHPFHQEIEDGYDTVEWCAAQSWSDGNVGMYGGSYVGAVQWLAALAQPPALKCIVPTFTASDYYEGWTYQGGAFHWGFMVGWVLPYLVSEGLIRRKADLDDFDAWYGRLADLVDNMQETFRILPLGELPVAKEFAPYFVQWLSHSSRDEFWQAVSIEDQHARVQIPSLNIGGWYDIFLQGTLRNFMGMRERGGTPSAREGTRLLMGYWTHTNVADHVAGTYDFGIRSSQNISPIRYDLNGEILRFFDLWLKGIDEGFADEPPVKLFVMGENVWRGENEWPLARTQYTHYYLHSKGRANSRRGDGWLSEDEPGEERPDIYLYDPNDPAPTCGGQLCCYGPALPAGAMDQSAIEMRRDVLIFSTPPLEQDLEVTGPIVLYLWASSSAPDTDFTAKLVDLSPCGYARNLTDGIIRARYREGTGKAILLTPKEVCRYRIDLGATSNLFRRGHCLLVEVSSSNFPRFDRNLNTGNELGVDREWEPAIQTIFHDRERPSHLLLPVIPR
jgi:putative CocE/NonD family hydrolase